MDLIGVWTEINNINSLGSTLLVNPVGNIVLDRKFIGCDGLLSC